MRTPIHQIIIKISARQPPGHRRAHCAQRPRRARHGTRARRYGCRNVRHKWSKTMSKFGHTLEHQQLHICDHGLDTEHRACGCLAPQREPPADHRLFRRLRWLRMLGVGIWGAGVGAAAGIAPQGPTPTAVPDRHKSVITSDRKHQLASNKPGHYAEHVTRCTRGSV